MERMTPSEAARRWAESLEGVPGILRSDLEVMTCQVTGCTGAAAHAAVLDATEERPGGGWQLKGRRALAVAILRENLARAARSRPDTDAAAARMVARP